MPYRSTILLFTLAIAAPIFGQETDPSVAFRERLAAAEKKLPEKTQERMKAVAAANTIWCGLLDREGILWFGSNRGVHRFDGQDFTLLTEEDGLADRRVHAMLEDADGILWFGTAYGLVRYDRKEFRHIPLPWVEINDSWFTELYPVMNPHHVASLEQADDGALWVGTYGAGAYRFDGETFTPYLREVGRRHQDGLHHNWVPSIRRDKDGDLWFASMSLGGIVRFDGKDFHDYHVEDGISDLAVRVVYPTRSGELWSGYNGNRNSGLNRMSGPDFTNFRDTGEHEHRRIHAIHEDRSGRLWFGCGPDGVCFYDGKEFHAFTAAQDLQVNHIGFFVEDATGRLWFGGSDGGLYRTDGKVVEDFSRPSPE